jgi:hypothetical protein
VIVALPMVIQEINETQYAAFLESRPQHSIFHRTAWLQTVREAYGVSCIPLGLFDGARLVGSLPVFHRRFLGLSLYGAPLPRLATPIALSPVVPPDCGEEFLIALAEWVQRRCISHFQVSWHGRRLSPPEPARVEPRDNLEIDLESAPLEGLWKKIKSEARNRIRHATREGVKVDWIQTPDAIRIYHGLLQSTYDRQGIRPNFPFSFYEILYNKLIGRGLGILSATYQGKVVAALWILHDAQKCYFWDGASIQELRQLAANHLLHWEVLSWAKQKGLKTYDMIGRSAESGRAGARPGIGRFKRSLGAQPVDYRVFTWQRPWIGTGIRLFRSLMNWRNKPKTGN